MSLTLRDNLISDSIDVTLAEIDRESQGLEQTESNDVVVGPFSVLKFRPESELETSKSQSQSHSLPASGVVEIAGDPTNTFLPGPVAPAEVQGFGSVTSLTDPLRFMDDFLHWSDILDLEFDPTASLSKVGVKYLKDTSGDGPVLTEMFFGLSDQITAFNGWDTLTFYGLAAGARGGIWGAAKIIPELAVELWDTVAARDI
ncbi:hypothetical protein BJX65DRAFT_308049 [Aspergillus insuetus]